MNPKNDIDDTLEISFVPMALIADDFQNHFTYETKLWKEVKKGFTHLCNNSVAFAKITPCFENGKSLILQNLLNGYGAGTTELIVLLPTQPLIKEYIFYFINSAFFVNQSVKSYKGTAGQQRLDSDFIKSFPIPLPPLHEQEYIAKKLDLLIALANQFQEIKENLKRIEKSLLKYAIEGNLSKLYRMHSAKPTTLDEINLYNTKIRTQGAELEKQIKELEKLLKQKDISLPLNMTREHCHSEGFSPKNLQESKSLDLKDISATPQYDKAVCHSKALAEESKHNKPTHKEARQILNDKLKSLKKELGKLKEITPLATSCDSESSFSCHSEGFSPKNLQESKSNHIRLTKNQIAHSQYPAHVYIMSNYTNTTLYIGVTSNLQKRIYEHRNKLVEGFSAKYNCTKLVYFEAFDNINQAIEREKYLKGKKRDFKNKLIESINPNYEDLYAYMFNTAHSNLTSCDSDSPAIYHSESHLSCHSDHTPCHSEGFSPKNLQESKNPKSKMFRYAQHDKAVYHSDPVPCNSENPFSCHSDHTPCHSEGFSPKNLQASKSLDLKDISATPQYDKGGEAQYNKGGKSRNDNAFTPPFEIPPTWAWVKLGDICEMKKGPFGSAITKDMFIPKSETSIKIYEQKNAIYKNVDFGDYYISLEYFEKLSQFEVFENDIIVSCAGTIGESYLIPKNAPKGIINQALMRIKLVNNKWIPYFLIMFDFLLKQQCQKNSNGSAIKNIPELKVLKNFPIPLPPLHEQEYIAKKLENLFSIARGLMGIEKT